jgi:hypothetical protein
MAPRIFMSQVSCLQVYVWRCAMAPSLANQASPRNQSQPCPYSKARSSTAELAGAMLLIGHDRAREAVLARVRRMLSRKHPPLLSAWLYTALSFHRGSSKLYAHPTQPIHCRASKTQSCKSHGRTRAGMRASNSHHPPRYITITTCQSTKVGLI